jgi:hypothetical protein
MKVMPSLPALQPAAVRHVKPATLRDAPRGILQISHNLLLSIGIFCARQSVPGQMLTVYETQKRRTNCPAFDDETIDTT